jgi:hypothetical protein
MEGVLYKQSWIYLIINNKEVTDKRVENIQSKNTYRGTTHG